MSSSNLTIAEFCERFKVSASTYYRMKRCGNGPREIHVGRRVIIPERAAHEWAEALDSQAS